MKIQITLTREQYELLIDELVSLSRICGLPLPEKGPDILAIVETQHEEVPE